MPDRSLVRPRRGRVIAGVCRALADHFGWNVTLVRVVFVFFGLWGPGEIAYLALWVLTPRER